MHALIDAPLELDEDDLAAERGPGQASAIIGDQDLRLLLRDNRLALAMHSSIGIPVDDVTVGHDITLTCVAHAHPKCRFEWCRLVVDLSPTPSARIADMSPREVIDDRPVQLTTTVGLGLKFDILADVLGAEIKPEYAKSRTVYFPQILSSGPGFTRGYWDFLAQSDQYLHANRELRLLVHAPRETPVESRFQLRARVKLAGLPGHIPLVAREGGIATTHRLDLLSDT